LMALYMEGVSSSSGSTGESFSTVVSRFTCMPHQLIILLKGIVSREFLISFAASYEHLATLFL
jgi:hypothetical protein